MNQDTPATAAERRSLPRVWLAAFVGSLCLVLGLVAGTLASRSSFVPDVALTIGLAFTTWIMLHIIEKAYYQVFAPRSSRRYGEDLREVAGALLDSSLRTAEWRHALANVLDRAPREFVESILLGSDLGYVIEREHWLRAEELGLVKPMCWRERHGGAAIDVPTALVGCEGSAGTVIEASLEPEVGDVPLLLASTEMSEGAMVKRVPSIFPPSSASASASPSSSPLNTKSSVRAYGFRNGKVFHIATSRG